MIPAMSSVHLSRGNALHEGGACAVGHVSSLAMRSVPKKQAQLCGHFHVLRTICAFEGALFSMDRQLIARLQRAPELGPEMVIFSGGTAFNETARRLKHLTHHTTHLLTPFDSGGSSASLRKAFHMPAVGDLRSRLMALADETLSGHQAVVKLFQARIPRTIDPPVLEILMRGLVSGSDRLLTQIEEPIASLVMRLLHRFFESAPTDFDYRGASLGNLVLTGAYLDHHCRMDPTASLFSRLVKATGTARLSVDANLHLGAVLDDGETVIGQHRMTGKEAAPLVVPVRELFINRGLERESRTSVVAKHKVRQAIRGSQLIVFAQGSFYTSLVANLLPVGLGSAIAESSAPKVWIPNLGEDPEQLGMTVEAALRILISTIQRDAPHADPRDCVTHVVFDQSVAYRGGIPEALLAHWGVQAVATTLLGAESARYCPDRLSAMLCMLALENP